MKNNNPEWAKDIIWYQIFPERFAGFNHSKIQEKFDFKKDWYAMTKHESRKYHSLYKAVNYRKAGGTIQGIIEKLDYIKEIGFNGIYLTPFFPSPSCHKYDSRCFHHVEEFFGPLPGYDLLKMKRANENENPASWVITNADEKFAEFVKRCHDRNIKVIADGVFNHSGREFFAFADILDKKEKSKYKNWYNITKWNVENADGFEYSGWYGHKSLPEFRKTSDGLMDNEYMEYIKNVLKKWFNYFNVDGIRLDAADCISHNFWKKFNTMVREIKSDAYLVGEIWQIEPDYVSKKEFNALMNYPFAYNSVEYFVDRIDFSLFKKNVEYLVNSYDYNNILLMQNLYSSHDTARLINIINNPGINFRHSSHYQKTCLASNPQYNIGRGDNYSDLTRRMMIVFQFIFPGCPMVYYGDEVGMEGANDPDCRKPMLWEEFKYEDEKTHPFSSFKIPERNKPDKELKKFYSEMIMLRHKEKCLTHGSFKIIDLKNNDFFGIERTYGNDSIIVYFNRGENSVNIRPGLILAPMSFKIIKNNEKILL
ncbi:MAG: glycoside hydrolase family 13 protein [Candidatus Muiribacteriota bacterium]